MEHLNECLNRTYWIHSKPIDLHTQNVVFKIREGGETGKGGGALFPQNRKIENKNLKKDKG